MWESNYRDGPTGRKKYHDSDSITIVASFLKVWLNQLLILLF